MTVPNDRPVKIQLFESAHIRSAWDMDAEKWWFSALDIVAALTNQPDYSTQRRDSLVKTGKLDPSWQTVKAAKPEQVAGQKAREWKVVFQNPAATDASKQTLYMFFSLPGNFIAANYTGQ